MYKETNKQRTGEKPHFTSTVEMVSFYDGSISGALTKAVSYIRNNGIPGFNIEGRRINA